MGVSPDASQWTAPPVGKIKGRKGRAGRPSMCTLIVLSARALRVGADALVVCFGVHSAGVLSIGIAPVAERGVEKEAECKIMQVVLRKEALGGVEE